VRARSVRWAKSGVWQKMFEHLAAGRRRQNRPSSRPGQTV
jgi:hypothetical protein